MSGVYEYILMPLFCEFMLLVLAAGNQGDCPPSFGCGYVGNISFPFTTTQRQDCGLFPIHNCYDPHSMKTIQLHNIGKPFVVVRVSQSPSPTLASFEFRDYNLYNLLQNESCEAFTNNYTLPLSFYSNFATFHIEYNATLFRCNRTLHVRPPANMHYYNYTKCDLYYTPDPNANYGSLGSACTKVHLPIKDVADSNNPFTFVTADIVAQVKLTDECANCHYLQRGLCQLDGRRFCCANGIGILQQKPWKHKQP